MTPREVLERIGETTREQWTAHPVCKVCNLSIIPANAAGLLPTCRAGIGGWCAGQEARAALAPEASAPCASSVANGDHSRHRCYTAHVAPPHQRDWVYDARAKPGSGEGTGEG